MELYEYDLIIQKANTKSNNYTGGDLDQIMVMDYFSKEKLPQTCGCAYMLCVYVYLWLHTLIWMQRYFNLRPGQIFRATSWPEAAGKAINQRCR